MNKTSKWIVGIIIVIIVVWGGYSLFNNEPASTEPIKIGFIGPLSGEAANYGESEKNIISLAIDDINQAGGINGRPIEMVYEDSRATGKDATSATQKLITIEKVKVILGGVLSTETLAAAPIAEQNKVILFSGFSSNPAITNAGDYIFRVSPSDVELAKLDADVIAKKYKRVAIISENTDYTIGVRDVMKGIFNDSGVSIVFDEVYNSSVSDFRTVLTKIKSTDAEVIYANLGTSPKAGGIIVRQARELGIQIPIHGNFSLGVSEALEAGGQFMNGVVISDSIESPQKLKDLLKRYEDTFGSKAAHDFLAGAAWDRINIIRDALVKVGYDSDKIRDYIYGMKNYNGMLGSYYFDKNGDVVGTFFANFVLQDGEKIPYEI